MSNVQKYISVLLERLPKWELTSYEHQVSLDKLRDRLSSAADIHEELRHLYQVTGFTDFALSLMWIVDKVEKDPTLEESTLEEETLVFSFFKQGMGVPSSQELSPAPTSAAFDLPPPSELQSTQPVASTPEVDPIWGAGAQAVAQSSPAQGVSAEVEQERRFSSLLERFLESVQSGNDDRTSLMSEVLNECNNILAANPSSQDYQTYCQLLVAFLQYISENQYLDDVRVMNVLSNVQDPFAQWTRNESANRSGLLDQAIDILRDFKTMFE